MTETAAEGMTFEKVWEMFKESVQKSDREREEDRLQRDREREEDRLQREADREADRLRREELDRQMKETDRKIGRLGSRIGQLIEHFAAANIMEKFRELGYPFNRISQNHILEDEQRRYLAEIDLFLENGDYALVVEVKTNLTKTDIKEHIKRMETLRDYANKRNDHRKYIGAAAAALVDKRAREFALQAGFYVVSQNGDSVRIESPKEVKTWE